MLGESDEVAQLFFCYLSKLELDIELHLRNLCWWQSSDFSIPIDVDHPYCFGKTKMVDCNRAETNGSKLPKKKEEMVPLQTFSSLLTIQCQPIWSEKEQRKPLNSDKTASFRQIYGEIYSTLIRIYSDFKFFFSLF